MKALVTRPRHDAERLAAALAARGIEPLIEPLLMIRPLANATARLARARRGAQAVLFTSANGVRAFAAASAANERDLPAFAVGAATAAAARAAGFPLVMSASGNSADLAALVIDRLRPVDGALLHAAGRDVAGELAARLAGAGFTCRSAVLYEAVPATRLSPRCSAALVGQSLDFAIFFSPRTAATFVRLAAAAGLGTACGKITAVVLSTAVAAALDGAVWRELVIAATPDEPGLMAALDHSLTAAAHPLPSAGRQEITA